MGIFNKHFETCLFHIFQFFILFLTAKAETFGKQAHAGIRGQGGIKVHWAQRRRSTVTCLVGKCPAQLTPTVSFETHSANASHNPFQKLNQELSPSCIFYLCATTWQHKYLTFTPSTQNSMILFGNFYP